MISKKISEEKKTGRSDEVRQIKTFEMTCKEDVEENMSDRVYRYIISILAQYDDSR